MYFKKLWPRALFGALMLLPGYCLGQNSAKPLFFAKSDAANDKDMEQQLIKLDKEFAAAEVRADTVAVDSLLADDFILVHAHSGPQRKAALLDELKSGKRRYEGIDVTNLQVHLYGTTALTVGRCVIRIKAGSQINTLPSYYLNVWVRQQGKWRMVSEQYTPIPAPPAGAGK